MSTLLSVFVTLSAFAAAGLLIVGGAAALFGGPADRAMVREEAADLARMWLAALLIALALGAILDGGC